MMTTALFFVGTLVIAFSVVALLTMYLHRKEQTHYGKISVLCVDGEFCIVTFLEDPRPFILSQNIKGQFRVAREDGSEAILHMVVHRSPATDTNQTYRGTLMAMLEDINAPKN